MLSLFLSVGIIHLLSAMSPGPDFIMVVKNSVSSGKKAGIITSLGISLALLIHISYCALGVGILISQSIVAFNIIKILGAVYLMYLGWKLIKSKGQNIAVESEKNKKKWVDFFIEGFLCNILNPKAALYFVSLFALFLPIDINFSLLFFVALEIIIIQFLWFMGVSFFFGNQVVRNQFSKIEKIINRVLGGVLLFFGIKILGS